MNRKQLIAWLKSLGYTGKIELAAVKAYLEAEGYDPDNIDVVDGSKSYRVGVDAVWAKTAQAKLAGDAENEGDKKTKGRKPAKVAAGNGEGDGDAENEGEDQTETKSLADLQAEVKSLKELVRMQGGLSVAAGIDAGDGGSGSRMNAKNWVNIANRKSYQTRINAGRAVYDDVDCAELMGAYQRLAISKSFGGRDYPEKRYDEMIVKASQVEYDNTLGGALVPREFSTYYQKIREKYGVARSLARVVPMTRDVQDFPRRGLGAAAGLTVQGATEGSTITSSTVTLGKVSLTAKKLAILTTLSSEIMRDAAISAADIVADEMGWAFSRVEDDCLINGDGSSTYYGFVGLIKAIKGLSGTVANIAGLYQVSSATWGSQTLTDLEGVAALLPELEMATDGYWLCNKRYFWNVLARLEFAGGGNTTTTIGGKPTTTFMGAEVKFARVLPRASGTSGDVPIFYGDISRAATIGDVTGSLQIEDSRERYFDQDLIAFRAIERIAISVHDVGDANATEASRNPGPVVAAIQP